MMSGKTIKIIGGFINVRWWIRLRLWFRFNRCSVHFVNYRRCFLGLLIEQKALAPLALKLDYNLVVFMQGKDPAFPKKPRKQINPAKSPLIIAGFFMF
jgi:hypothetical protein